MQIVNKLRILQLIFLFSTLSAFILTNEASAKIGCNFYVTINGVKHNLVEGWKFWHASNVGNGFYKVSISLSNQPSSYAILLISPTGDIYNVKTNQSTQQNSFTFDVGKDLSIDKYKFRIITQYILDDPNKCESPEFWIGPLPSVNLWISSSKPLTIGETATVKWNVTGGITNLSFGGWTGNIRLQWYQNGSAKSNLAQIPVSNGSYSFTVPSSINNSSIPGSGFQIAGVNAESGTSIPGGHVYDFSEYFEIKQKITYSWQPDDWTSCNAPGNCGTGVQELIYKCVNSNDNTVSNSYCSGSPQTKTKSCNEDSGCVYQWKYGNWGNCSETCGWGTRTRDAFCRDQFGNTVSNYNCSGSPKTSDECNETYGCKPPVANISSIDPSSSFVNETISFSGYGSDPDGGSIISYKWRSSIDGQLSTQSSFTKSNLSIGNHIIYFQVQDDEKEWSTSAVKNITISQKKCPSPEANFISNKLTGELPLEVQFTDQSIALQNENIISWEWDFGDGSTSLQQNPSHIYNSNGIYTVKLTITNSCGQNHFEIKENLITVNDSLSEINLPVPFKAQYPPGTTSVNSDGHTIFDTVTCGQTSCAMIFAYYNKTIPTGQDIKDIIDWLHVNVDGQDINNYNGTVTDIDILKKLAIEYAGFKDSNFHKNWTFSQLENELRNGYPVIVAVRIGMSGNSEIMGHFMVLRGFDEQNIYVNDPGKTLGENNIYSKTEFLSSWGTQNNACVAIHSEFPLGGGTEQPNNSDNIDLDKGLVAYYPFNGNANDESGNGNDGTVYGATLTKDKFGNDESAFIFDGVDDYIEKESPNQDLNIGNQSWSFSVWIQSQSTAGHSIVSRYECGWDCGNQGGKGAEALYEIGINKDGFAYFGFRDDNSNNPSIVSDKIVSDNNWHHIAYILDRASSILIIFIDGKINQEISVNSMTSVTDSGSPFEIGRVFRQNWASPSSYFNGKIDEIRIYNRALSENDIIKLYGEPDLEDGLIAYYPFNGDTKDKHGSNDLLNEGADFIADQGFNGCYKFERNESDYMYISDSNQSDLDITGDITISAWVKLNQLPVMHNGTLPIVTKWEAESERRSFYWEFIGSNGNDLRFVYSDNGEHITGTDTNTNNIIEQKDIGEWVHLVVTASVSTKNISFYKNSIKLSTINNFTDASSIYNGEANFEIGTYGHGSQFFDGLIDEVKVFNRTLSEVEILKLYEEQKLSDLQNGLVAYYQFNGNADDESGNGNHGTAYGGLTYVDGVVDQAGNFDGVDDFIEITPSSDVSAIGDFAISVWTYVNEWKVQPYNYGYDRQYIFDGHAHSKSDINCFNRPGFCLIYDERSNNEEIHNVIRYEAGSVLEQNTKISIKGEWHHHLFMRIGDIDYTYFDGQLLNSTYDRDVKRNVPFNLQHNWFIGTFSGNNPNCSSIIDGFNYSFVGLIDEMRIYNRALSEAEIKALYNLQQSSTLSVIPSSQEIPSISGSTTFTVTSNQTWTATTTSPWLTIQTNNNTITANYEANTGEARTGIITVTAEGSSISPQTVEVRQVSGIVDLEDGLVAYYPFNRNANDESGNENHGTVYGASLAEDRFGIADSSYSFDGTDDYVQIDEFENFFSNDFTVSLWVNFHSFNDKDYPHILYLENCNFILHGMGPVYEQYGEKNLIGFYQQNDCNNPGTNPTTNRIGQMSSQVKLQENKWYFVTIVKSNNNFKMYINNELQSQVQDQLLILINGSIFKIGSAKGNNNFFNGAIDDIRIYNRTLFEAEINALYEIQPNILSVSPPFREVSATNGTTTFTVNSNLNWSATTNDSWLTLETSENTITVNYEKNTSEVRTANITITAEGTSNNSQIVEVRQESDFIDLDEGLVAYYPFNGNANDESGNGNNLSIFDVSLNSDNFGLLDSAYYFNGTSSYLSISDASQKGLDITSDFTVVTWIKITKEPVNDIYTIINKGTTDGYNGGYGFDYAQIDGINKLRVYWYGPQKFSRLYINHDLSLNKWYHIIVSTKVQSVQSTYYINGNSYKGIVENNDANTIIDNEEELRIGSYGKGSTNADVDRYFNGVIGEIRLYSRTLSENESKTLYESKPRFFAVSPSLQKVQSNSGITTFEIKSNLKWTATTNDSWLTIQSDEGKIIVNYEENTGELRIGKVTISAEGATNSPQVVEVRQSQAENNQPVAKNQDVITNQNKSVNINLIATDVDGDLLTYKILQLPYHGTLTNSNTLPNIIYTPNHNYQGNDSFSFKVNDGKEDSKIAIVNINIKSSGTIERHFKEISGNPADATWTIYLANATIDKIDLQLNDEIAVFDNNLLVGSFKLSEILTDENKSNNYFTAWSTLSNGDGYKAGNQFKFKCWDVSEQKEYTCSNPLLNNTFDDAYTGDTFPEGDGKYSILSLAFLTTVKQTLNLSSGYQFVSLNVKPDNIEMKKILADILDNVDFIKDSNSNMLRKMGPNWVNNIGDWKNTEGYLIKIKNDDVLQIEGTIVDPETQISVKSGYQFVAYLLSEPINAQSAFIDILDNTEFIKDSNGNMLRRMGPNWVNNIGTLNPGEGYLLKMSDNDDFQYKPSSNRKMNKNKNRKIPEHFGAVSGNPADDTWTIYIAEATIGEENLETDDEIAIFDGDKLVGVFKLTEILTEDRQNNNYLTAWSTLNNGDGYTAGNHFTFKCWDSSRGFELSSFDMTLMNPYNDGFTEDVFPDGDGKYSIAKIIFSEQSIQNGDMDKDGRIDLKDVIMILKSLININF